MIVAAGTALGVVILVYLGRLAYDNSRLESAIVETRSSGDPAPVVAAVREAPEEKRPAMWDESVGQLWQAYERETAARLVVSAAGHSDATILQYWIQKVIEVEPDIADDVFDEEFLREHYDPDVAARCGMSGCCS